PAGPEVSRSWKWPTTGKPLRRWLTLMARKWLAARCRSTKRLRGWNAAGPAAASISAPALDKGRINLETGRFFSDRQARLVAHGEDACSHTSAGAVHAARSDSSCNCSWTPG